MPTSDLETFAGRLERSEDYKVLRRFNAVERYNDKPDNCAPKIGIYCDVETTGLNTQTAKPIELAMILFEYDAATGTIFDVIGTFDYMEDPNEPLLPEITDLTGITDNMVKGQHFDDEAINGYIRKANIMISHNAFFDRQILERRFPESAKKPWACSVNDIDWQAEGVTNRALPFIVMSFGFFYKAHRADMDAMVGLHILAQKLPVSGAPAMIKLLESARRPTFKVWAVDSPFDYKDILKERGYRWFPGNDDRDKSWVRTVLEEDVKDELSWLEKEIYKRACNCPVTKITAVDRYSIRD